MREIKLLLDEKISKRIIYDDHAIILVATGDTIYQKQKFPDISSWVDEEEQWIFEDSAYDDEFTEWLKKHYPEALI